MMEVIIWEESCKIKLKVQTGIACLSNFRFNVNFLHGFSHIITIINITVIIIIITIIIINIKIIMVFRCFGSLLVPTIIRVSETPRWTLHGALLLSAGGGDNFDDDFDDNRDADVADHFFCCDNLHIRETDDRWQCMVRTIIIFTMLMMAILPCAVSI